MKFSQAAILALSLVPGVQAAGGGDFYTYYETGGLGPSRWQFVQLSGGNNQCGGTNGASGYGQSPVTVDADVVATCDTNTEENYNFITGTCGFDDLSFSISNNGVIVSPKADSTCTFGRMDIPHTPNTFKALQFHIHTYSEHAIVGEGPGGDDFFPAELHVVHQEELDEGASFAVFGTMIDATAAAEDHPTFEWFLRGWESVARGVNEECRALDGNLPEFTPIQEKTECPALGVDFDYGYDINETAPAGVVDLYRDLPTVDTATELGFFTYKGGLTTPACTEAVNWNLGDKPMVISLDQLTRLEQLIHCYVGQTKSETDVLERCEYATVASETGSTSRPPQPLSGRRVIHRCPRAQGGPDGVVIDDIGTLPPTEEPFEKPVRVMEPANADSSPKCDKNLFQDCSDDPRYNPKVSPNLKAGNPIWYDMEGYWHGRMNKFQNDGTPLKETFASDDFLNTYPYPQNDIDVFVNISVVETRLVRHITYVYPPASIDEFCRLNPPAGASNVLGNGICGIHGYASFSSTYGVATFEKDGSAKVAATLGQTNGQGEESGSFQAIDDDTIYHVIRAEDYEQSETTTFTNSERTRISGSGQFFIFSANPPYSVNPLAESFVFEIDQVSKETFMEDLEKSYVANNVIPSERVASVGSDNCVESVEDDMCPTEEMLRKEDPKYASSPYDDDDQLKGGFIALFVILGAMVCCCFLVGFHMYRLNQQADRYKHQFARRIAQTIELEGTHEKLTPEALEAEFKKIDHENNGVITREELKEFMGENMNDRDFDAMFAAIDLDHNGTLEFSEFCAFMAQIGAVYDEEQKS